MSGEELKIKLKEMNVSQAEVARRLGVIPQSIVQSLCAKDVKSGFLEDLSKALNVNIGFFYGEAVKMDVEPQQDKTVPYFMYRDLQDRNETLVRENQTLKERLSKYEDNRIEKKIARL